MLASKIASALTLIPSAIIICILLMYYIDKTIEVAHRRIGPRLRFGSSRKAAARPVPKRVPKAAEHQLAEPVTPAAPE
jgi:hypothetical protein